MDERQSQIQQILHQATASPASSCIQPQMSAQFIGNIFCVYIMRIYVAVLFHVLSQVTSAC